MSAVQTLKKQLEALQCHFTWDLSPTSLVLQLNILKDIGTDEGNVWLAHIWNLQGFLQHKLGSDEEALKCFNQATKTLQRQQNTDEGPWLIVNFGNLACFHHLMNEDEKSQAYLSKVDDLMKKYPVPPVEELHPEVCAEKAWTLIKFDREKKHQAVELFKKATQMQPQNVAWQSSYAIILAETFRNNMHNMTDEVFEMLKYAKECDPHNLYIAALYLQAQAAKGQQIMDEAQVLADRVLERSPSSYNGIRPLLKLYRDHISKDKAVELVEKARKRHPDSRYLKRSAAICHSNIILSNDRRTKPLTTDIQTAISLWEEVMLAYCEFSFKDQLTRASLHGHVDVVKADKIYNELLQREDLDSAQKQRLYSDYAKYLYFKRNDKYTSMEYHMRVAEIPEESKYRQKSIIELKKALRRKEDQEQCRNIHELLTRLGNQS